MSQVGTVLGVGKAVGCMDESGVRTRGKEMVLLSMVNCFWAGMFPIEAGVRSGNGAGVDIFRCSGAGIVAGGIEMVSFRFCLVFDELGCG